MTENQRVLAALREHQDDIVADLARLVEMESPSDNKEALDRLGEHLAARLRSLGAQVDVAQQEKTGNHVRARWNDDGSASDAILMLCHMDTVWDMGTLAKRPVHRASGRLSGSWELSVSAMA